MNFPLEWVQAVRSWRNLSRSPLPMPPVPNEVVEFGSKIRSFQRVVCKVQLASAKETL